MNDATKGSHFANRIYIPGKPAKASNLTAAASPANNGGEPPADADSPDLDPGEFPLDALNPVMRRMVEAVADVHQVPVVMPATAAVAIIGGALGNAFKLVGAVNGKISFGNLYVIIGSPKSSGKGSVAGALMQPLLAASQRLEDRFTQEELPGLKREKLVLEKRAGILVGELASGKRGTRGSKDPITAVEKREREEELEAALQRLGDLEMLLSSLPSYWISNSTSEAAAVALARNKSALMVYSPEGGEILRVLAGKYRKDSQGDFDLMLSGYSVEPMKNNRITRGMNQLTPCVNMILLVQPGILRELLGNEEAFERGMTARILTVIVETVPLADDGVYRRVSKETEQGWEQLFAGVFDRRESLAGGTREIICSPEAKEIFRGYHNEVVQLRLGKYRDIEAELGRARENAIRIAQGQCVADDVDASILTEDQAERGVQIARWFLRSNLRTMNEARARRQADRAEELYDLLDRKGGRESLRNLDKSHGFSAVEIREIVKATGPRFVLETASTGGRPSETLSIAK